MKLHFYKYQGTGNDFVIIDNRDGHFDSGNVKLVNFLCDRRFGIGADGLMLLENNSQDGIDFTMRYFNSDGNEASMCGNGGRCIAAFAVHQKAVSNPDNFSFDAVDGLHEACYKDGIVSLKMTNVDTFKQGDNYYFLNTGSPHYVKHMSDIDNTDLIQLGREVRYSEAFKPGGTNVNIVEEITDNHIKVRTYERGVEDETYSCGTGVVASAISTYIKNQKSKEFDIDIKGGKLQVKFDSDGTQQFNNIWLTGPATFVFEGNIEI